MRRLVALLLGLASPASCESVSVCAASSLQSALDEAGAAYEAAPGDEVRVT